MTVAVAFGRTPQQLWAELPPRLIVLYYEDIEWRRFQDWVAAARAAGADVKEPKRKRRRRRGELSEDEEFALFKKAWAEKRARQRMGIVDDEKWERVDIAPGKVDADRLEALGEGLNVT